MKLLPLCLIAGLAACRQDRIETRRAPKEPTDAPPHAGASVGRARGLRWNVPAGWRELPGDGMRAATFAPSEGGGKAEATAVSLAGDAGGELANVNRWRGQVALPPVAQGDLAKSRSLVRSPAGAVAVYDFAGGGPPKVRIVAGMIKIGETTWFFKLAGEDGAVSAAKPAFLRLLGGLENDAP